MLGVHWLCSNMSDFLNKMSHTPNFWVGCLVYCYEKTFSIPDEEQENLSEYHIKVQDKVKLTYSKQNLYIPKLANHYFITWGSK